jgi:hypothetical protein
MLSATWRETEYPASCPPSITQSAAGCWFSPGNGGGSAMKS